MRLKIGRQPLRLMRWVAIILMLAVILMPLLFLLIAAFEPNAEVVAQPVKLLPRVWTLQNFAGIFSSNGSGLYIRNSLVATIGSTLLVLAVATPAAYAIGRHRFLLRAGDTFSLAVLAARFIPGFMIVIPLFLAFRYAHLLDSLVGMVILYTGMNLPLVTWVILPVVRQLPDEIMQAASLDGASVTRTFFRIGLPLLRPAMATAATLAMIFAWNEFFTALVFTQQHAATAPILLSRYLGDFGIQYGQLAANALLVSAPIIVLGIIAQRHLVRGLTAGAVK